jgi:3-oxoadipate enol-lactonase
MWDSIAPRLKARRVVAHDLPGHGSIREIEDTALDAMARRVKDLVEARREPVHLVGFSMGGMVAMRVALTTKLAALTLISTRGDIEPERERYEKMADVFRAMPPSVEVADAYLALQMRLEWAKAHPDVRERYRRIVMGGDREGIHRAALAVLRREPMLARLADLRVPTLVLAGTADVATPPDHARRLAAAIPGARLVLFDGAPHLLHEEHPDEVARLLLSHEPR